MALEHHQLIVESKYTNRRWLKEMEVKTLEVLHMVVSNYLSNKISSNSSYQMSNLPLINQCKWHIYKTKLIKSIKHMVHKEVISSNLLLK
jgi:hypothetical protein